MALLWPSLNIRSSAIYGLHLNIQGHVLNSTLNNKWKTIHTLVLSFVKNILLPLLNLKNVEKPENLDIYSPNSINSNYVPVYGKGNLNCGSYHSHLNSIKKFLGVRLTSKHWLLLKISKRFCSRLNYKKSLKGVKVCSWFILQIYTNVPFRSLRSRLLKVPSFFHKHMAIATRSGPLKYTVMSFWKRAFKMNIKWRSILYKYWKNEQTEINFYFKQLEGKTKDVWMIGERLQSQNLTCIAKSISTGQIRSNSFGWSLGWHWISKTSHCTNIKEHQPINSICNRKVRNAREFEKAEISKTIIMGLYCRAKPEWAQVIIESQKSRNSIFPLSAIRS